MDSGGYLLMGRLCAGSYFPPLYFPVCFHRQNHSYPLESWPARTIVVMVRQNLFPTWQAEWCFKNIGLILSLFPQISQWLPCCSEGSLIPYHSVRMTRLLPTSSVFSLTILFLPLCLSDTGLKLIWHMQAPALGPFPLLFPWMPLLQIFMWLLTSSHPSGSP